VLAERSFAVTTEPEERWDAYHFAHADFAATDWEVVPWQPMKRSQSAVVYGKWKIFAAASKTEPVCN
jgi:hypothetical protein